MLKILLPKDNISEYSKIILNKFQSTKAVLSDFRYVPEKKKELNEKIFIYNPKENEIIIFNSYLYHWVDKYNDTEDRISIAWDAIYTL